MALKIQNYDRKRLFPINGERLVAVEHAMFTFDDLKVNSRDDRQTRNAEKTWLLQENLTSIRSTAVK